MQRTRANQYLFARKDRHSVLETDNTEGLREQIQEFWQLPNHGTKAQCHYILSPIRHILGKGQMTLHTLSSWRATLHIESMLMMSLLLSRSDSSTAALDSSRIVSMLFGAHAHSSFLDLWSLGYSEAAVPFEKGPHFPSFPWEVDRETTGRSWTFHQKLPDSMWDLYLFSWNL